MSRHPVTPMDEADLRLHLAKQTSKSIGLLDVVRLEQPDVAKELDAIVAGGARVVLIDLLSDRQLPIAGGLLAARASRERPLFAVGSSGLTASLCAHWKATGAIAASAAFKSPAPAGPIVAICGSCSPVTARQVDWATKNGFATFKLGEPIDLAIAAIKERRSIVIHSGLGRDAELKDGASAAIGQALADALRGILSKTEVRRVLIAGGDTSARSRRRFRSNRFR